MVVRTSTRRRLSRAYLLQMVICPTRGLEATREPEKTTLIQRDYWYGRSGAGFDFAHRCSYWWIPLRTLEDGDRT